MPDLEDEEEVKEDLEPVADSEKPKIEEVQ